MSHASEPKPAFRAPPKSCDAHFHVFGPADRYKHGGVNETFKVPKISGGVGVERTFPLHSPMLASIELVREGRVRRAKLYYLRALRGKAARIRERRPR